jgi:hypothetical protein
MTHYDPNRPGVDPRDPPGARRSEQPHNAPVNPSEPVIHDAAPIVSGAEARQGPRGRAVLAVLVASLVLALIAWAAVEFYPRGTPTTAQTQSQDVTGSTPSTAGGIPLSPPAGSPEGAPSQGQTAPDAPGAGRTSAPSPSSDSAR